MRIGIMYRHYLYSHLCIARYQIMQSFAVPWCGCSTDVFCQQTLWSLITTSTDSIWSLTQVLVCTLTLAVGEWHIQAWAYHAKLMSIRLWSKCAGVHGSRHLCGSLFLLAHTPGINSLNSLFRNIVAAKWDEVNCLFWRNASRIWAHDRLSNAQC